MNAYKLNSISGNYFRKAITDSLEIPFTDIYKVVKEIKTDGTIVMHSGRKFKLKLIEV